MKLKELIKDLELGKVYTDKDKPPFKVNEVTLKRFKVFVSGQKEPLVLMGKDIKSVKQLAYQMIQNSSIRVRKVVKEGKLNEFNKKHFLNLIKQQIESLKGQIAYSKDKIRDKNLEQWERKEYAAVLKDNIKDLKAIKKHYKRVEKLSEGKLTEAGAIGGALNLSSMEDSYTAPKRDTSKPATFLQKFSSKEARATIDGALKNYVKDLRKVQGRVVKDWMKAAKANQIDFFDIIRGLKTGDVRRAHQYETDFLVSLLTKDKIIDRFRSYFKGKKGKKR